jgi:hypothetical protein
MVFSFRDCISSDQRCILHIQIARFDGKRWVLFREMIGHERGAASALYGLARDTKTIS